MNNFTEAEIQELKECPRHTDEPEPGCGACGWAVAFAIGRKRDEAEARVARLAEATPEAIAQLFHETYERLAPDYGYKTREASAVPWEAVPDKNKGLMIAVAGEVLATLKGSAD